MTDEVDNIEEIRRYLELMEQSMTLDINEPQVLTEDIAPTEKEKLSETALADLKLLLTRWTAFSLMESQSEDYATGYEAGLQKAAEMLETIIDRHFGDILTELNTENS